MIVVKTRMRSIPEACAKCTYYLSSYDTYYDMPGCTAIGGYSVCGKPIRIKPTKQRPKWCPIMEAEE